MTRYIDADAAIDAMCGNCDTVQAVCSHYPCKRHLAIESLPTADVVPVVHGRWEEKEVTDDLGAKVITEWQSAKCSVCGLYHTTPYLYYFKESKYCPNCGAKMEGAEG